MDKDNQIASAWKHLHALKLRRLPQKRSVGLFF